MFGAIISVVLFTAAAQAGKRGLTWTYCIFAWFPFAHHEPDCYILIIDNGGLLVHTLEVCPGAVLITRFHL